MSTWAEYEKARDALVDATATWDATEHLREALDAIVRAMAERYDRVCAAVGEHFDTTTSGGDEGREPAQIVEVIATVAGRMTALELALLDSYRRNGSAQINGGPWQQMFQPWTEAEVDSIHAFPPAPRTQEASNAEA